MLPILAAASAINTVDTLASGAASLWKTLSSAHGSKTSGADFAAALAHHGVAAGAQQATQADSISSMNAAGNTLLSKIA